MDEHTSYEQAYKNGYEKGYADGKRDAVEAVHGYWIEGKESRYACSVCKKNAGLYGGGIGQNLSNFCPNCGADMRGEEDGNTI